MRVEKFNIAGPLKIILRSFKDHRGVFTERYSEKEFEKLGFTEHFVQDNHVISEFKTLRGLHFQKSPHAQGKLVCALKGEIFDVAVDLRAGSSTYGKHIAVTLNESQAEWLWIPRGFAHGYCVTSPEGAHVWYKTDSYYAPETEGGLHYSDPTLDIRWPITEPILSEKDRLLPTL